MKNLKIYQNLIFIFLLLLAFYPLVKFNISSFLFILFCVLSLFISIKERRYNFSRKTLLNFLAIVLFYLILLISCLHSENGKEAISRITQLSPLILTPFVIIFLQPFSIKIKQKKILFNVFILVNIVFSLLVFQMLLSNLDNDNLGLNLLPFSYDKIQFLLMNGLNNETLFVHKAYFSMGFVFCSLFSLSELQIGESSKKNILYSCLFLFFTILIIYTFSFPNVIAFLICVFGFTYYRIRDKTFVFFLKKAKGIFFSISIFLIITIFLTIKLRSSDNQRIVGFVTSVFSTAAIDKNDARKEIYNTYMDLFSKSSALDIIFGYGIGDAQDELNNAYRQRLNNIKNKNDIFFNEAFDNSYWFKNNLEVLADKTNNPRGGINADLIIANKSNSVKSYNLSTKVAYENEVVTFSVYAKPENVKTIILRLGEIEHRAIFNLNNESIKILSNQVLDANIIKTENNWLRCSITARLFGKSLVVIGLSNEEGDYVYERKEKGKVYLWGAQLEKGEESTEFVSNKSELIRYAIERDLNTHNNYLFFLMSGGVICVLSFIYALAFGFYISFKNKDFLQISFLVIISMNLFTENIFSRHWGLMFTALFLIVLFLFKTENNSTGND